LIEAVTALAILTLGGAMVWFGLARIFSADHRFRLHQAACEMLASEAESLRGARRAVRDTQFVVDWAGDTLTIRRTVLDSARYDSLSRPYSLEMDPQLKQAWTRRPQEVLLEELKTNSRVFLVLPDYRWF
jgi:hypothetical protein